MSGAITGRRLVRLLKAAGFRVVFAGYWNTMLFPLMVLTRKLLPDGGAASSDVKPYSPAGRGACAGPRPASNAFCCAAACGCRSAAR